MRKPHPVLHVVGKVNRQHGEDDLEGKEEGMESASINDPCSACPCAHQKDSAEDAGGLAIRVDCTSGHEKAAGYEAGPHEQLCSPPATE